ncbi:hypothetical protein ACFORL_06355 [Legionella dresdenensis]|uniref:Substrate of the Dot/Icm secretion system n=1 Tax=Legionella dresdenensis TaxID=450200 RepID=A0ABV8CF34_9GAMM
MSSTLEHASRFPDWQQRLVDAVKAKRNKLNRQRNLNNRSLANLVEAVFQIIYWETLGKSLRQDDIQIVQEYKRHLMAKKLADLNDIDQRLQWVEEALKHHDYQHVQKIIADRQQEVFRLLKSYSQCAEIEDITLDETIPLADMHILVKDYGALCQNKLGDSLADDIQFIAEYGSFAFLMYSDIPLGLIIRTSFHVAKQLVLSFHQRIPAALPLHDDDNRLASLDQNEITDLFVELEQACQSSYRKSMLYKGINIFLLAYLIFDIVGAGFDNLAGGQSLFSVTTVFALLSIMQSLRREYLAQKYSRQEKQKLENKLRQQHSFLIEALKEFVEPQDASIIFGDAQVDSYIAVAVKKYLDIKASALAGIIRSVLRENEIKCLQLHNNYLEIFVSGRALDKKNNACSINNQIQERCTKYQRALEIIERLSHMATTLDIPFSCPPITLSKDGNYLANIRFEPSNILKKIINSGTVKSFFGSGAKVKYDSEDCCMITGISEASEDNIKRLADDIEQQLHDKPKTLYQEVMFTHQDYRIPHIPDKKGKGQEKITKIKAPKQGIFADKRHQQRNRLGNDLPDTVDFGTVIDADNQMHQVVFNLKEYESYIRRTPEKPMGSSSIPTHSVLPLTKKSRFNNSFIFNPCTETSNLFKKHPSFFGYYFNVFKQAQIASTAAGRQGVKMAEKPYLKILGIPGDTGFMLKELKGTANGKEYFCYYLNEITPARHNKMTR